MTGLPHRLLGRSPIERSTSGVRVPSVDGSVRDIAAANHGPSPVPRCCHRDGIGPRESSVSRCWRVRLLPWLPDCSGCLPLARPPVLQYVHSIRSCHVVKRVSGAILETVAKLIANNACRSMIASGTTLTESVDGVVPRSWGVGGRGRRPQRLMVDCLTLSRGVCRTPNMRYRDAFGLAPRVWPLEGAA